MESSPAAPGLDLESLNERQRAAVLHPGGPLLVLAGAGSGKTRVLTQRIAYLLATGVAPQSILAITFTNKAAQEMKARVEAAVGPVARTMWVSTFHSACVRILRSHADRVGMPKQFSIYDAGDAQRVVRLVVNELGFDAKDFPAAGVAARLSWWKNHLLTPAQAAQDAGDERETKLARIYAAYNAKLASSGAVDFDDLLGLVVRLFREHPDVLAQYQQRFSVILVDEYQDTNQAQNEIVLRLGALHHNVCVVGDADQAIYGFRAADFRNILAFERAFPDVTTIVLDRNYRSTQHILDAANAVIAQNRERKDKALWTATGPGAPIVCYSGDDDADEAAWVVRTLVRAHDAQHRPWSDLAVLYRTNAQSRRIEEQLVRTGVPYRLVGGTRFYERAEVKDALAYLRVAVNPTDEVSIKRVLNTPRRGIGDTSVGKIDAWARVHGLGFGDALARVEEIGLGAKALAGVTAFIQAVAAMRDQRDAGPGAMLQAGMDASGYRDMLRAEATIEAEGRLENLDELYAVAREHAGVEAFLEEVALVADVDEIRDEDAVLLMTVHASKGLEFPVVFLVGMEEGIFPHSRALGSPQDIEEERRLAYVGMTRAREQLLLSHAWARVMHGEYKAYLPSRFLGEIPAELLEHWGEKSGNTNHGVGARSCGTEDSGDGAWEYLGGGAVTLELRAEISTPNPAPPVLDLGDEVHHAHFGVGVVVGVEGVGVDGVVAVRFANGTTKRLMLAYAPLTKHGAPQ